MPAAYDNKFVVVTVFIQLKVVVVEAADEPHLVLAATTIEMGDELLFDYNDRQSRLQFLKSCPVCGKQSACRKRSVLRTIWTLSTGQPVWPQQNKARETVPGGSETFLSVCVLTRSMLEAWLPSITDDNVSRILLPRNMAATNVMVSQIIRK